jgi:hypothetical protein
VDELHALDQLYCHSDSMLNFSQFASSPIDNLSAALFDKREVYRNDNLYMLMDNEMSMSDSKAESTHSMSTHLSEIVWTGDTTYLHLTYRAINPYTAGASQNNPLPTNAEKEMDKTKRLIEEAGNKTKAALDAEADKGRDKPAIETKDITDALTRPEKEGKSGLRRTGEEMVDKGGKKQEHSAKASHMKSKDKEKEKPADSIKEMMDNLNGEVTSETDDEDVTK